jgi:hypothetical protein
MIKGIFGSAETLPKASWPCTKQEASTPRNDPTKELHKQLRKTTMQEVNFCIEEPTRTLQHKMMMLTQVQWTRFVLCYEVE